ncbi:hypothetical protein MWU54_11680 [Marivita sp. S6314]|uniref:hypothetical protein n=1 Tax=Marivita sp. S6314 TaxID=2926406 RepID=UPI001FF29634|nr:hypothetical protein [Marivita sp. S6314]MCK0150688.1 hypothetical protein [Marivita sp. S6314]
MTLKCLLTPLAAAMLAMAGSAALADDSKYKNCSLTPADAIGPMFETQTAADCEAACMDKASEGCIAWSYMKPSAMFPDKPGNCRMITVIFAEEEGSDRFLCGKL